VFSALSMLQQQEDQRCVNSRLRKGLWDDPRLRSIGQGLRRAKMSLGVLGLQNRGTRIVEGLG
jgi:hypothetical protein